MQDFVQGQDNEAEEHMDLDATEKVHNLGKDYDEVNSQDEDKLSDSFHEEASTVDLAEEQEKQTRRSLLYGFLYTIGVIFFTKQLLNLIYCCSNKQSHETAVGDIADGANEVGQAAGMADHAQHALIHQQSMANVANPSIL
jgi:hypothetical protein